MDLRAEFVLTRMEFKPAFINSSTALGLLPLVLRLMMPRDVFLRMAMIASRISCHTSSGSPSHP